MKALPERQERAIQLFAQNRYIDGKQGYTWNKALREAGYSDSYAHKNAQKLWTKDLVQQALDQKKSELSRNIDIEIWEIVQGLRAIAYDPDANRSEKTRAFELLGKYKAMFTDNIRNSHDETPKGLSTDEIEALQSMAEQLTKAQTKTIKLQHTA